MAGKPKSVDSYKKTIWRLTVAPYITLKGCLKTTGTKEFGLCYTCGKRVRRGTKNCQAGHWKSRSRNGTLLEEDNLRLQCDVCNSWFKGNGMRPVFEANLRKEIGDMRVDRLIVLSKKPKQFTIEELQEIKEDYERKMEELENANGGKILRQANL